MLMPMFYDAIRLYLVNNNEKKNQNGISKQKQKKIYIR